jgi:hypothetical protein
MDCKPRNTSMKSAILAATLLAGMFASPCNACLPPPPGFPEPKPLSIDEQAKGIYLWASDIVEGVIVSAGNTPRFKILRTLKGRLRVGTVFKASWSFGFPAPMCSGMIPPPFGSRGMRGVVAFRDQPELKYLDAGQLESMFVQGLINRKQ